MFSLAGLREFADSSEKRDFTIKLTRHVALEEDRGQDFVAASSSVSPKLEKDFYIHIDKFTSHLDQIIKLVNDSNKDPSEEALTREASEMQKALYQARLLLDKIDFKKADYLTDAIWQTYAQAQNCYYYHIRPNTFSVKDLDIPHLDLFSFRVHRVGGREIIKPIEFRSDYRSAVAEAIEELLEQRTRDPDLDRYELHTKEVLYEELTALAKDLIEEAKDLIPPEKRPPDENTIPGNFIAFVKDLNDCFREHTGAHGYDLHSLREVHSAIYLEGADNAITSLLLEVVRDERTEEPSKAVRLLLLVFLMQLYGLNHKDSVTKPEDLDHILTLTLESQAMSQTKIKAPTQMKLRNLEQAYQAAYELVLHPKTKHTLVGEQVFPENHLNLRPKSELLLGLNSPALLEEFRVLLDLKPEKRGDSWLGELIELGKKIIQTVYRNAEARIDIPNSPDRDATRIMSFVAAKIGHHAKQA